MFTVFIVWRVKAELEHQFIDSWSEITEYYRENLTVRSAHAFIAEATVFGMLTRNGSPTSIGENAFRI